MEQRKTANIRQVLLRRCGHLGIPVSGTFELTPRCNLQCKMCYVRLTAAEMNAIGRERTAEEWISFAREAKDAGMAFLLITGGEPTLRHDFCQIYEALAQMGFSISINTNGTLFSPAIRELWHRLPPAQVNVTLYGICREDYGALCANPDAFDAVVDGLAWLRSEGILTHLNATMTPVNKHRLPEMEQFARDRGLELRLTSYCFPPVRRDGCSKCADYLRLSPEEAAGLAVEDILFREGGASIQHRLSANTPPAEDSCSLEIGEPIQCMAGHAQFWITWDGKMTPCGMLSEPSTDPFGEDGFRSAWDALRKQTEKIRLCAECVNCELRSSCMNCAAVTHAETGRFDGKPEYMCRYTKAYRDALKRTAEKLK